MIFSSRLLKKTFESKIEARPVRVSAGLYMAFNIAFHLRPIWLLNHHSIVAIDSESWQRSFQSFFAPSSEVAMLFDWNLSRQPLLGQIGDLQHADFILCLICARDQGMIE